MGSSLFSSFIVWVLGIEFWLYGLVANALTHRSLPALCLGGLVFVSVEVVVGCVVKIVVVVVVMVVIEIV